MATLVDLQRLTIESAPGSIRAATRSWTLLDDAGHPAGFVVERVGSSFSLLRRHLSSHPYRHDATYEVTDTDSAVELVLSRAPSNFLKTQVRVAAALADGSPVATATQTGAAGARGHDGFGGFDVHDPNENLIARIGRKDARQWTVTGPAGEPFGAVRYLPPTRSMLHPDGSTTERWEIEHAPTASARVRVAVLAAMIASSSFRPA